MNSKIIETNSKQRWEDAREIFEKIKPLLDEGWIYSASVREIMNIPKSYSICCKAWFKDIVEYGESKGYSKKEYFGIRHGGRKKKNKIGVD